MIKRIKLRMKIYNSKNIIELKELPVLDNGSYYIYCMLNSPAHNIKIGITTNIVQRLQALSGSNGGGNKIIKLWLSDPTFVVNAEKAFHEKFAKYRIEGTEWFDGSKLTFEEVITEMENQFNTKSYKVCNKIRKELAEKKVQEEAELKKLELESQNESKEETDNSKKSTKTKSRSKRSKKI